ncbi:recombination-associated protein RdgC [Dasania sp. GY-MA-18]|uniref:Recombination-associated protein RdgC n=1 Tax=Dasania phycosphaerae TaxID=2950436 RepID=A0A9J6RRE6_9GAMM|nr:MULTISPECIES: recombination-associated protein RdgC [Dasania]MCR8924064.1 recombination-associated protein RdgC [Dasania sp. GY-MA-18]MCZ0866637.1 recombination-associated protein RdgC [Dasania phycosphaerae]MCZ0870222.1 recombination-associated protein RdgC [Dasania phycosphaerae]
MWFKNLLVYRFTKPFTETIESLEVALAEKAFNPCGSQELSSYGWAAPLGKHGDLFTHTANGFIMLCAQRQDKVLPAGVINEALAEKIEQIQARDGRSVGRKERVDLKDEVMFELLPKAFTRSSRQYAYIDPREGLLIINTGAVKRAEEFMSYLRETIGSLPVIAATAKNLPQHAMTQWVLENTPPAKFELGGECELRDKADESSVIRCKNQDLGSKEINNHLAAGMCVNKLAMSWQGGIDFIVDDQLAIKRISFGDLIQEQAEKQDADDAAAQFDVDFSIMTLEFAKFIKDLYGAFGGEDLSELDD